MKKKKKHQKYNFRLSDKPFFRSDEILKKWHTLFLFLLLLLPIKVFASDSGTEKFYIDATIREDGSMLVKEYIVLNGTYNGTYRNLYYKGDNLSVFRGLAPDDFYKTDIYNGSNITDIKVASVSKKDVNSWNFSNIDIDSYFSAVPNAYTGLKNSYTITQNYRGYDLKIYNPSSTNTAFYIEYVVEDAVVVHNDCAEMLSNFIGKWEEDIASVQIMIHLPSQSNELRIFSHGPLDGENELVGRDTAKVWWNDLSSDSEIDARIIFDKELVPFSSKKSNVNALDMILEFEENQANHANQIRMQARIVYYLILFIILAITILNIILVIRFYLKYDKEYRYTLPSKYFRDFPNDYGPEIVGYLFTKNNIKTEYLSASLLELVRKKALRLEMEPNKKNFKFENQVEKEPLTKEEEILKKWFLEEIGNGEVVTNKNMKDASKKNYDSFITKYDIWKNAVIAKGSSYQFFENNIGKKALYAIWFLLSAFIVFGLGIWIESIISIILLFFFIICFIYVLVSTKRTKKGNEDYEKWKALKNFMLDFSNMSEKELPELMLWEKYLVYATAFGIADKVQKAMKMRIEQMNLDTSSGDFVLLSRPYLYMNSSISNMIHSSVNNAVNTAISTRAAAHSSNSSSGGFGGGSSFGGGGGGIGGGGGRF